MGEINQGRYDRLLRRTTAQVGGGSKVGNALEDLFPVLELENAPIEILRASGWRMGMGRISRVAAAGQGNAQQLFNPVDSGYLMVVTRFATVVGATVDMTLGPAFVELTDASVAGAQRDTRDGEIRATVGLLQREDNGAASNFWIHRLTAGQSFILDDPNGLMVLAPGTGFRSNVTAAAQNIQTSYMWRERVAEPEELDF